MKNVANTDTDTSLAGYAAFYGRQVLGTDSNADRLLEAMLEHYISYHCDVRGVTQAVLDAIENGETCLDIVCVDLDGVDGTVYGLIREGRWIG